MKDKTLLIVTTVPETLMTILATQPGFLNQSFKVHLASSGAGEMQKLSTREGVPVHEVKMQRGMSPFRDLVSIFAMCRLLRKLKPDVVHSYTPKAGMVAMVAGFLCRVPVRVHTFTGLIFPTQTGVKQKLLINIDRLICFCATRIVPEGRGVKKDLVEYSITRKPLDVIGHGNIAGVDLDYFRPGIDEVDDKSRALVAALNIASTDFVFCYVGRLNRDKGLKELGLAFKALPDTARLILVGGLDSAAPVDDATLQLFRDHDRIHVLGFQADIRVALATSNVLVLPSYREGFPNVVLQAGALGKPSVVTNISGSNEIIEPGLNGWVVPSKDAYALQVAMAQAMVTPKVELEALGEFARSRIAERFDQAAHRVRMKDFYLQELGLD